MSPLGEHRSAHIYKTSALLNDGDTTAATESAATAPLRHATGGDLPALCALLNMSVAPGSQDTFDSRLAWIAMAKQQQMLVLQGTSGEPLAACTLLFEPKFLRGGSLIAHVEGWCRSYQPTRPRLSTPAGSSARPSRPRANADATR